MKAEKKIKSSVAAPTTSSRRLDPSYGSCTPFAFEDGRSRSCEAPSIRFSPPRAGGEEDISFTRGGIEKKKRPLIGFIGQGFIGKNYADDFEHRGYAVVRYARSPEFAKNKERIQECAIIFIAVPTPSTPKGFDYSIVESVLPLVGKGKTAVIKSTILPGTTEKLQKKFPDIFVFHSPEFLREASAAYDAAHPDRNIVGFPKDTPEYRRRAKEILAVLPHAPFERAMHVRDAELVKYGSNCFLYMKVLFANLLYDVARAGGLRWQSVRDAVSADPRIGSSHMEPIHASGHMQDMPGRGAGGHCFIKDFAAFSRLYAELVHDPLGQRVLDALRDKNNALLRESGKDIDLLEGVYGRAERGSSNNQFSITKQYPISKDRNAKTKNLRL